VKRKSNPYLELPFINPHQPLSTSSTFINPINLINLINPINQNR